jgi:hypothetical protein
MTDTTTAPNIADAMFDLNGNAVAFAALPYESAVALVKRGLRVVFGNEASSDVNRAIRKLLKGDDDKKEIATADITAWRDDPANTAALEGFEHAAATAMYDKIMAGELGVGRASGGLSSMEKTRREAAKRVLAFLYSKLSPPRQLPSGKGSKEKVDAQIDMFLADTNGVMTANTKRFDRMVTEVTAEKAAKANALPEVSVDELFGVAAQ